MFETIHNLWIEHRELVAIVVGFLPAFLYLNHLLWYWAFHTKGKNLIPPIYAVSDDEFQKENLFYLMAMPLTITMVWFIVIFLVWCLTESIIIIDTSSKENPLLAIILIIFLSSISLPLFIRLFRSKIRKRILFFFKLKK